MMNSASRKPCMRDIAKEAGVSLGTVSRVLSGKHEVAPEFAQRVISVAREMGYQSRLYARTASPRSSGIGSIGYLLDSQDHPNVMSDPFQQHFLAGIEQKAGDLGGHVVFASVHEEARDQVIPSLITDKVVRSVILKVTNDTPQRWIQRIQALVPTVIIMHRLPDHSVPSVMCDNYGGMFSALQHLVNLGHRRIGFYSEDDGDLTSFHHIERQSAFEQIRRKLGLIVRPGDIQMPVRNVAKGETFDHVIQRGLQGFLSQGEDRPTAIVCAADIYAFGFMKLMPSYGLSVPSDLSLIGFMNTQMCDYSTPPLSSVSLMEEEIGRAAVDLLSQSVENPAVSPRQVVVGARLIERNSCAIPQIRPVSVS